MRQNKPILYCEICGNRIKNVWGRRYQTAKFCSVKCKAISQSQLPSEKHSCWKGGRRIEISGYISIRIDKTYKYEHRYIMEKVLNRPLKRNEIVHHIDGDRQNNHPSNLLLLENKFHDSMETTKRHRKGTIFAIKKRPDITFDKIQPLLKRGYSINKISKTLDAQWYTIKLRIIRNNSAS